MHLMFFLSGLFVWGSVQRRGGRTFLYDRCLRLGVPFLLGVYLLIPVTYYSVYRTTAADPSWSAYWSQWLALPFWPVGPMWFLSFLLVLNVVVAILYWVAPRTGELLGRLAAGARDNPGRFFVGLLIISALTYLPLSAVFAPWQWIQIGPFGFQPSFAPQYVIYFFAGLAIGAHGLERGLLASDGRLAQRWWLWLASAPAAFLLWIGPMALIVHGAAVPGLQIAADLGFVLAAATACFGLAAAFLRFATFRHRLLDGLSEHAYAIYFFHYPFVLWLQYLLLGSALFVIAKAAIVFGATLILSWTAAAAMCRIPLGARLMGRRELARAR
jgi:glucans biosynthesis protein C